MKEILVFLYNYYEFYFLVISSFIGLLVGWRCLPLKESYNKKIVYSVYTVQILTHIIILNFICENWGGKTTNPYLTNFL